MRIGIDIDGVVSDSYPAWLAELNIYYGKNITVLKDYEMHLVFDVPRDDMHNFFMQNADYLLNLPHPVKGAKEGIEHLISRDHEVIYVTARSQSDEQATLKWMKKHGIPYEHILFTSHKSKVDFVRQWQIELFIEDYLVNAKAIAQLQVPVLLLNTSYNQGDLPKLVTRCGDWACILEQIQDMKG